MDASRFENGRRVYVARITAPRRGNITPWPVQPGMLGTLNDCFGHVAGVEFDDLPGCTYVMDAAELEEPWLDGEGHEVDLRAEAAEWAAIEETDIRELRDQVERRAAPRRRASIGTATVRVISSPPWFARDVGELAGDLWGKFLALVVLTGVGAAAMLWAAASLIDHVTRSKPAR